MVFDADGYPIILFDPVPMLRRRKHGWDPHRQQAFIAMLCRTPSVSHAARAVGMSVRSAYALLDKPGAEEFAKAWDMALEEGMTRLRGHSLSRSLEGGDYVPVFRKGRMVRVEYRPNDRLAIALLGGRSRDVDIYRRGAQTRWRQRQEWNACDADRAAHRALTANEQAAAEAAFIRRCEKFIADNPPPPRVPRVRAL